MWSEAEQSNGKLKQLASVSPMLQCVVVNISELILLPKGLGGKKSAMSSPSSIYIKVLPFVNSGLTVEWEGHSGDLIISFHNGKC